MTEEERIRQAIEQQQASDAQQQEFINQAKGTGQSAQGVAVPITETNTPQQPVTFEQEQDYINKSRGLGEYANQQSAQGVGQGDNVQGINPVVVGSPEQVDAKSRKEKIMSELFSYRPEKPLYDANRPEELKRLARNSVIAKGINLIGDNIALAKKANVNRTAPDNAERTYLGNMYNYLDDYARRVDTWNYQDFANKLRKGELALREANSDAENARRDEWQKQANDRYDKNYQLQERQLANSEAQRKLDNEFREKSFKAQQEQYKQARADNNWYRAQTALAQMIRAQNSGSGRTAEKPYYLHGDKGSKVELEANEREKVLGLILSDPNIQITQNEMDLLEPKMGEPVSTNSMNMLVQKYWQQSGAVQKYLKEREEAAKQGANGQQTNTTVSPIKYPGAPLREGEQLPEQGQFGTYTKPATQQSSKPKKVIQNGITYTLNETTGEYE